MKKVYGYGPEVSEQDAIRLDGVIDKMIEHLKIFDQKKVSSEDVKKVEGFKNGAGVVVRGISVKRDCLVAAGKMAAAQEALEYKTKAGVKRKSA
ncbi:MAG: hypothetical protein LBU19_10550 [Treponema sp.]|jgi:hypothetical protein|nr:hypothetical protein [Treponema sp.]